MSKIAFVTLLDKPSSKLSPHFGLAKWVMILDLETRAASFVRNTELTGRAVIDILVREACEEVIFRNIGQGALRQLKTVGIGGWLATENRTAMELADDFSRGQLHLALHATRQFEAKRGRGAGAVRKTKPAA